MAEVPSPDTSFPLKFIPRRETGADSFLTKYPGYDGRGITIGIFDTGVDPGAPGLQLTGHGERKVVDCIDCSGSGDVEMTLVKTAATPCDDPVQIEGVSRRQLKLCNQWKNPSGDWWVGVKLLDQLFPNSVNTRIRNREEENVFGPEHRQLLAKALRDLEQFTSAHPSPSKKEKEEQDDLQARVDVLQTVAKKISFPALAADVVAFHDRENWRVAISTDEEGDMTSVEAILPFRVSGEYSTFPGDSVMNYTVDVFDDGSIVSIVTTAGAHGTHVAGIAAGYSAEKPELTGVAPGAQIVSMKIGDSRLDTMETGPSLVRACLAAVKYKCDMINLSYGESCHWTNKGRAVEMFAELAKKHGIVVVASAGNNGPCLSTTGCPGGTTSELISVGAYVSPEMMQTQYSLIEKRPGLNFTWSSAGPTTDGNLGVDISAPGGAISSVPTWTLRCNQLMNGTSMSAPNACGCIALILSGLKDKGTSFSPFSVRRAVINTAHDLSLSERFVLGQGLIQVEPAFDWLCSYSDVPEQNVWFEISCALAGRSSSQRGIYLRDGYSRISQPVRTLVTVRPHFPRDIAEYSDAQLGLDLKLSLVSTKSWVAVPTHLAMSNMSRGFEVATDTRGLEHGAHYAEVQAYDTRDVSRGPLFRVPVTVVISKRLGDNSAEFSETLTFSTGHPQHRFISVPESATFADLTLTSHGEHSSRYNLHAIQLEPHASYNKWEFKKSSVVMVKDERREYQLPVMGGTVLDLTIAKWWAHSKQGELTYTLHFHSLKSVGDGLHLHFNNGYQKLLVYNGLGPCYMQPQCTCTHAITVLQPIEHKPVLPLGERDTSADGSLNYQLQLTYKFSLAKGAEVSLQFRYLSAFLYESFFHGQMWMLYDSNKRFIASGDAYPRQYVIKLEKGDYTVRFQARHHNLHTLEPLKDLQLTLSTKLSIPIQVDVYGSQLDLMRRGSTVTSKFVPSGTVVPVFLAAPKIEKIPSTLRSGGSLEGRISFSRPVSSSGKPDYVDSQPFTLSSCFAGGSSKASPPSAKKESPQSSKVASKLPLLASVAASVEAGEDVKVEEGGDKYQEALLDFNISWMVKNGDVSQYDQLSKANPDHIPLLQAYLEVLHSRMEKTPFAGACAVIASANKILSLIDIKDVMIPFYCKDTRPPAVSAKSAAEKQRMVYQDTLVKKGNALSNLLRADLPAGADDQAPSSRDAAIVEYAELAGGADLPRSQDDALAQFEEVMADLESWFDLHDSKIFSTLVLYYSELHWYGRAAKVLLKKAESNGAAHTYKDELALIALLEELGYQHVASMRRRSCYARYPQAYVPF